MPQAFPATDQGEGVGHSQVRMPSSEKRFDDSDVSFFFQLMLTLTMIVMLWGLLGR